MQKKQKVIFVQTEGWFFLSHFVPLADAVSASTNHEGAIIATIGDTKEKLQNVGLEVFPLEFERGSFNLFSAFKLLLNLISLLRHERPDIVHFIALKPIILGGIASLFLPNTAKVYHLTGLGYLVDGKTLFAKLRQYLVFKMVAFFTNRANAWLITENPDDLAFLQSYGATKSRFSLFAGAGVDAQYFKPTASTKHSPIRVGYIGRMIWSKGVDVLVDAATILQDQSISIQLDLYGAPDIANPNTVTPQQLEMWTQLPNVTWHGTVSDVRNVWAESEIAVMPTRTREGMPRALLEAAACGRALVVTDVPGCRHFVSHRKTGLVVPPEDAEKLANAIKLLVLEPQLRSQLGHAARKNILNGYTEEHIRKAIMDVYANLETNS